MLAVAAEASVAPRTDAVAVSDRQGPHRRQDGSAAQQLSLAAHRLILILRHVFVLLVVVVIRAFPVPSTRSAPNLLRRHGDDLDLTGGVSTKHIDCNDCER